MRLLAMLLARGRRGRCARRCGRPARHHKAGGRSPRRRSRRPRRRRSFPSSWRTRWPTAFMKYALSTILGRALPDARDGLKPVHRRILFAMRELKLEPSSQYRKCARVVGEVLGKFHPHGDSSVYEALVRMAQDFVMSERLVDGHGNFGSVDGDPPAAMRLHGIAIDEVRGVRAVKCVGPRPGSRGRVVERRHRRALLRKISTRPSTSRTFLPARLPVLLVNGAQGIAVGMATNIPPHNLGEVATRR